MTEELIRQTVTVQNPSSKPTQFVLEPWSEVYEMPGSAEFEVVAEGPPGGVLEVNLGATEITVFGWVGARVWLYHNGSEVGARPDGEGRTPPPAIPGGMTMSQFVHALFREPTDNGNAH